MSTFDSRSRIPAAPPRGDVAVLLFGVPKAFVVECQIASRGTGAACASVRDLQSACRALASSHVDVLVAATSLPPWDRDIVAEHAQRAGVPLEWWSPNESTDAALLIHRWQRARRRSSRPG